MFARGYPNLEIFYGFFNFFPPILGNSENESQHHAASPSKRSTRCKTQFELAAYFGCLAIDANKTEPNIPPEIHAHDPIIPNSNHLFGHGGNDRKKTKYLISILPQATSKLIHHVRVSPHDTQAQDDYHSLPLTTIITTYHHQSHPFFSRHNNSKMRHHWPPQAAMALLQLVASTGAAGSSSRARAHCRPRPRAVTQLLRLMELSSSSTWRSRCHHFS